MKHALVNDIDPEEILEFFTDVFTASANAEEGELVGGIARQLAQQVDDQDVFCFTSTDEGELVAAIFFSRLTYPEHLDVLLMSPVAVSSAYQGKGLGQAIITYALEELRRRGVDIAITYGDPAFYGKTGFVTITEDHIKAPYDLSMPIGWLGQSLTEEPLPELLTPPICNTAFNAPELW